MSLSEKDSSEEAEALVDSLTIDSSSLNEGNLQGLSTSDFQTLTELSQELTLNNNEEDETEEHEMVVETQEVVEHEEEVETEEMSNSMNEEMEHSQIMTEDLEMNETKSKPSSVPPLRPLTIAPKPAKIPLTVKPTSGQQLFLVQGGGGGQTIKLLSPQGQELNVANFISRPITLKPTFKTITSQGGNISIVQQKPVVMKKILAPGQKTVSKPITSLSPPNQHFMVLQKADQQAIKLIQAPSNVAVAGSATKTITLQQAQEMGLVVNKAKLISQAQTIPKTVLLKNPTTKTVKFLPQVSSQLVTSVSGNVKNVTLSAVKSPAKILPAGTVSVNKGQRIIFKATGPNQTILPAGQLIQVSGSQALNTGQLHQINIPGKGMQYIKFVAANPTEQNASAISPGTSVKTSSVASGSNIVFSEIKPLTVVSKIAPKPTKSTIVTTSKNISTAQMVMIPTITTTLAPANKIPLAPANKVAIPAAQPNPTKLAACLNASLKAALANSEGSTTVKEEPDSNGIRPRKPCNCTKSQCLKLYCDCFANGEFCYMCNCMNCFNNLENEEHRNRAIKACLERNPHAFRPKIGKAKDVSGDVAVRKHTKGCNCKRSGCLKNYCECYEAKIACSNNCKCIGCRNIEDCIEKKNIRHITSTEKATNTPTIPTHKIVATKDRQERPRRSSNTRKQTINFITDDVIEATCQCLLTISDNADEELHDDDTVKRLIIEEFGRCLTEIIDCSSSRNLS